MPEVYCTRLIVVNVVFMLAVTSNNVIFIVPSRFSFFLSDALEMIDFRIFRIRKLCYIGSAAFRRVCEVY